TLCRSAPIIQPFPSSKYPWLLQPPRDLSAARALLHRELRWASVRRTKRHEERAWPLAVHARGTMEREFHASQTREPLLRIAASSVQYRAEHCAMSLRRSQYRKE